ncbi:acyltransferase family protein [Gordonia hydrophobica]|uniref:Acyltransferase family protein n=1 Tax=Gordonia hydrophobica TaxID=40516 RepID=A0ABZ2U0X0_9ACTN|nr:acyltransferase family protein [Gordonia hydrophobica]MBM7367147.1 peptidoglycan/LPS O-acetylase OafA/YrhL [Gordonia hydrophobica]
MSAPTTGDATPSTAAAPAYRTDLDGLRGIAIALVACFHVWFGRVSGGVDVFLTLSGYFFVGSLVRHTIHAQSARIGFGETVSPWPRLQRLFRRLLPALYTLLIVVGVLTIAIVTQTRWQNIGREIVASALYYQNYYLAKNSQDYLAASSANSPLQHLWSMSMQGQFFVGALIVLLTVAGLIKLLGRRYEGLTQPRVIRAIFAVVVGGTALASFAWAQHRLHIDQPYNYYDTLSRLWEPLVGGLLAIWMPTWRVGVRIRGAMTVIALILIATCGWWIDGVASYPAALAWVPVGATLLVIWSGNTAPDQSLPRVNQILASKRSVWLGSLSYSLYLIHWPLLIFYLTWRGIDHANVLEGTGILLVSIGLAWLTKRYIEDPLRGGGRSSMAHLRWPAHPRVTYTAALTVVLVLASGATAGGIKAWDRHMLDVAVDTTDLDPALYPGARALLDGAPVPALDPQPTPLAMAQDLPQTGRDGFMSDFAATTPTVGVYGDPNGGKTIAVAGGSHAEMWIGALDAIGRRNGFRIVTYLKMGCPLTGEEMPTRLEGTPYPECRTWVRAVMDDILRTRPDAVFTNSTRPDPDGPADHVPAGYLAIFDELTGAGIPVVGIRDTPWPHKDKRPINTPECLAGGGSATTCGTVRASALNPVDPAQAVAATNPLFHPLDLSNGVCTADFCPAVVGNIIVYKDFHHLSTPYVRTLTHELSRQLAAALGWTGPEVP